MPPLLRRPQRRASALGADASASGRMAITSKRAYSSSSELESIPLPDPVSVSRSLFGVTPVQIQAPSRVLAPRQQETTQTIAIIPAKYPALNSSPEPGTVVGIVLGAVGGFLIFFWLLWTCMNFGNPPGRSVGDAESSWGGSTSVISRRSRRSHSHSHHHHHHHHRHSSRGRRETIEIRSSRGAVPVIVDPERPSGGERIRVVEEVRTTSTGPRRSADEDEIIVEEERSTPPRRSRSHRRSSTYREEIRRSGGSGRRRHS